MPRAKAYKGSISNMLLYLSSFFSTLSSCLHHHQRWRMMVWIMDINYQGSQSPWSQDLWRKHCYLLLLSSSFSFPSSHHRHRHLRHRWRRMMMLMMGTFLLHAPGRCVDERRRTLPPLGSKIRAASSSGQGQWC